MMSTTISINMKILEKYVNLLLGYCQEILFLHGNFFFRWFAVI